MSHQSKEANIILAIKAIHRDPGISIQQAAKIYKVSKTTLHTRLRGRAATREKRNARHILTSSKEETLIKHVIDLDSRGFSPRIDSIRDMANILLTMRQAAPIGKL